MNKKTFIFYADWYDYLKDEPEYFRLKIYDAIVRYAFEGIEPEESIKREFKLIRGQLDRDANKYNDIIDKRREAGRKGAEKTNEKRWGVSQQNRQVSASVGKSQQKSAKSAKSADNVNVNDNINKETSIEVKKDDKEKDELYFVEEEWKPVVKTWFDYKKERRERYKSERSMKCFVTSLKKLSNNSTETALQIIEQSMANNWQGIFELKNKTIYGTDRTGNTATEETTAAALECIADKFNELGWR